MKTTKDIYVILAYEKGYRIDNHGVVYSPKGNVLKPKVSKNGYYMITINHSHQIFCHRLMAYQKYKELLFDADCVRHLNGIKTDNSYENIAIGSYSENMMDIPKRIRVRKALIASKIKYFNVDDIVLYYQSCKSYKQTMEKFNISSKGTLNYLLRNRKFKNKDQIVGV